MKRRGLFALGFFLLSTTALMPLYEAAARTTGQDGDPRQIGLVKPLSSWKVGTISADGTQRPYCAMVGTFERGMVMAIARNDKGMGSMALDFKDPVFETNVRYPVWVDLAGGSSREFQGVASSDRSLVVQFGKDESFYRALTRASRVDVSTPDVDVGFVLAQTQGGSRKLESCAAQLVSPASGDISEEQEVSDNPVDVEASRLTAENAELQKAREELASLKAKLASAGKYQDIETEISRRMAEHERRYQARVAELERSEKELQRQLDERKNQIVWSEQSSKKTAEDTAVLARLETEKKTLAGDLDAMTRQNKLLQAALEDKVSELNKNSGAGAKEDAKIVSLTRELESIRSSSQKQIAELTAALERKSGEAETLARTAEAARKGQAQPLSAEQTASYKQQIAGLEKQLVELRALRDGEQPKAGQLQAELEAARAEIAALKESVPQEQQRVAALQASLDKRQADIERQAATQAEEARRLDARRAELEKLRGDIALNQYQGTMETRGKVQELLNAPSVSTVQLSSVQAELTRKQADLERQASAQKAEAEWLEAERARLEKMKSGVPVSDVVASEKKELEAARARISQLEKDYQKSTVRVAELEASFKQRLSGQATDNARQLADIERREQELAAREAELGQKLAMVDKKSVEVETKVEDKTGAVVAELAKAKSDLAAERANVAATRVEMARLQQIIAADQQKIAALQGDIAAKTTLAEASAKTDLRLAELASENERLKAEAASRAGEASAMIGTQNKIALLERTLGEQKALLAQKDQSSETEAKANMRLAELASENERLKAEAAAVATANKSVTEMQGQLAMLERTVGEQKALLAQRDAALESARAREALASVRTTADPVGNSVPERAEIAAVRPLQSLVDVEPSSAPQASVTPVSVREDKPVARNSGWRDWLGINRGEGTGVWSYGPVRGSEGETAAVAPALEAPHQLGPAVVAVPAVPVQRADVLGEDRASNRAAAFLDEIIAIHRGDKTSFAEPVRSPASDAFMPIGGIGSIEPASGGNDDDRTFATSGNAALAAGASVASVVPAVGKSEAVSLPVTTQASLVRDEAASVPAVPPAQVAAADPAPVSFSEALPAPSALAEPQLPQVTFDAIAPQAGNAETGKAFHADPGIEDGLRDVLSDAGIGFDALAAGNPPTAGADGFVFYQWQAGELNGLFEQAAWDATASFESMVESYIDRYREDCPGQLSASIGNYEKAGVASMVSANVSCGMPDNSYVTAFVFSGVPGAFSAFLHTGFPDAKASVLSVSRRVEDKLRARDGKLSGTSQASFSGSGAPVPLSLPVTEDPAVLSAVSPAAGDNGSDADDFETVYIQ